MDLDVMKAAITLEGMLSGTSALALIAEVERLELENNHLKFIRDDLIERKVSSERVGDNLRTLLGQHDAHWRAVADALGGICCGGVDIPVSDPLSTSGAIVAAIRKVCAERDELAHQVSRYEAEAVGP